MPQTLFFCCCCCKFHSSFKKIYFAHVLDRLKQKLFVIFYQNCQSNFSLSPYPSPLFSLWHTYTLSLSLLNTQHRLSLFFFISLDRQIYFPQDFHTHTHTHTFSFLSTFERVNCELLKRYNIDSTLSNVIFYSATVTVFS